MKLIDNNHGLATLMCDHCSKTGDITFTCILMVRYTVFIYLISYNVYMGFQEELDSRAVSALRRAIAEGKQRWSVIRWMTKNLLY
jgi:hypothetical protein